MARQVLFATGDVMAQQAVEKVGVDKHNFARTGRMALYGGGIVSPPLNFSLCALLSQTTPHKPINRLTPPHSRLRPRSHDLVFLPRAPNQLPHTAQPDDRGARADRPDRLRVEQPLLLPVVDGHHGGDGPEGEAREHVLGGAEEELDGVAGRAGGEFQVRAVGASGFGCECCQFG